MKLLLRLSKAGRQGLVAVKRQVTRRGKTFSQTFYVRPSKLKEEREAAGIDDPASFRAQPMKGGVPDNRPEGGFFITYGDLAVRVPQNLIAETFTRGKYQFVVHRKVLERHWGTEYVVTEVSTGLGLGVSADDPEAAKQRAIGRMDEVGDAKLDRVIASGSLSGVFYTDAARVVYDANTWPVDEVVAKGEIEEFIDDLYDNSKAGSIEDVRDWLNEHYEITSGADLEDLKLLFDNTEIIDVGMRRNLDYEDAERYLEVLDQMYAAVDGAFDRDEIEAWADRHKVDLSSWDFMDYVIPTGVTHEEFVEHAISRDLDPTDAADDLLDLGRLPEGDIPDIGVRRAYQDFDREKREQLLTDNTEVDRAELGGGANETVWVRLADGDEIEGVWKPQSGESRFLRHWGVEDFYVREALAWEVDKALGLNMVPPTVIQQIGGEWGSVQEFVGDALPSHTSEAEKFLTDSSIETLMGASLFDFLMMNTDRHPGNIMWDGNGNILLIDNGLILPNDTFEGTSYSAFYTSGSLPESLLQKIRNADWGRIINWMVDNGIDDRCIDPFTQRLAYVMDTGDLPNTGEMYRKTWSKYPVRSEEIFKQGAA